MIVNMYFRTCFAAAFGLVGDHPCKSVFEYSYVLLNACKSLFQDVFRTPSDKSAILEMWYDVLVSVYSDRSDSDICS